MKRTLLRVEWRFACFLLSESPFCSRRTTGVSLFGYILFCAFPVIGCASPLAAVLSDCTSPWRLFFQIVLSYCRLCFQIVPPPWRLCFQIVPLRCQIYFQTAPHNKTCWWKVESREFVFSIRKSIGKSIRKSDSTTRSVRPILWTQAAADAVHMYTSTAFSIYPPICMHCTSKSQPPYNHRTIYHASTAQASYAQCAAKVQALCKHRTLNLSPKHKHCANNTLFADFSAPFLAEFAFPSRFLLSA